MGDYVTLPADNINLEIVFSAQNYTDVRTENEVYVCETTTAQHSVFEFKNQTSDPLLPPTATCRVKSSLAPSESTVYLQIYNFTIAGWENLDSDNTTAANTKFTLTATLTSGLSDHRDIDNFYSFRIYQLIQ